MTDKEAMAMALEALEDTHYRIISAGLLDQDLLNRNFTVATALRERLAQPEQEPVAGFYLPIRKDMREGVEALIAHAKRARWTNVVVRKDAVETTYEADWIKKLIPYTTLPAQPPQRKPLTDEEIEKLADDFLAYQIEDYQVSGVFTFARAIEAAHGIKENT